MCRLVSRLGGSAGVLQPLYSGEYEVRLENDAVLTLTRTYKDQLKRFLPE